MKIMLIYLSILLVSLRPCLSLPLAKGHDVQQIANINPQTIDYNRSISTSTSTSGNDRTIALAGDYSHQNRSMISNKFQQGGMKNVAGSMFESHSFGYKNLSGQHFSLVNEERQQAAAAQQQAIPSSIIPKTTEYRWREDLISTTNRIPSKLYGLKLQNFKEQRRTPEIASTAGQFHNDLPLLMAIQQINPYFQIIGNDGLQQHYLGTIPQHLTTHSKGSQNMKAFTAPNIADGRYFLPYLQQSEKAKNERKIALILEPHSKAVVGNGGTAISTPISQAYLKRGLSTNIYFQPEAIAIAGVGGKAHAEADLELNLFN